MQAPDKFRNIIDRLLRVGPTDFGPKPFRYTGRGPRLSHLGTKTEVSNCDKTLPAKCKADFTRC
jgi:hypothetical protein